MDKAVTPQPDPPTDMSFWNLFIYFLEVVFWLIMLPTEILPDT